MLTPTTEQWLTSFPLVANKRSAKRENERREALAQKGIYEGSTIGGGYSDDKAGTDGIVEVVEENAP